MNCAVIGAGAWGTALANLLADNGHQVMLWAHEREVAHSINSGHENRRFLNGVTLNAELRATNDPKVAVDGAEVVVFAAPSHVLRSVAASITMTRSTLPCDSPMLLMMAATSARTACAASRKKTKAKRVSFGMPRGGASCFV